MRSLRFLIIIFLGTSLICSDTYGQGKNTLTVKGRNFELNGEKFEFTGVSFFNAIFNPEFNRDSQTRREWIRKFKDSGINVLRVWCQWDNERGFVDSGIDKTIFNPDGTLVPVYLSRLKDILRDADSEGTVILLVLFSRESWNENLKLSDDASDKAVAELASTLMPYGNLVLQVWNEFNYRTIDYYKIIKGVDPERIVTNSPGYSGELGSLVENQTLDYLSPHTTRNDNRHWQVAMKEIEYLIEKYNKPVVDDEPARKGTPLYGGPKSPVIPTDHIIHIYNVWKAGGYVIYHHDMFQTGSGSAAVPSNGIPAPGFSDYHDQVFTFLKNRERYLRLIR